MTDQSSQRPIPSSGWIEVIVGSMFSGKSEELIRRLRRAQIAKRRVQVFKPAIDDRFSETHITSHSEMRLPSIAGLKTCTRRFAIWARRSRRMSSSLLPLNMLPTMTSIHPDEGIGRCEL